MTRPPRRRLRYEGLALIGLIILAWLCVGGVLFVAWRIVTH